jgi:hypothetical protein
MAVAWTSVSCVAQKWLDKFSSTPPLWVQVSLSKVLLRITFRACLSPRSRSSLSPCPAVAVGNTDKLSHLPWLLSTPTPSSSSTSPALPATLFTGRPFSQGCKPIVSSFCRSLPSVCLYKALCSGLWGRENSPVAFEVPLTR